LFLKKATVFRTMPHIFRSPKPNVTIIERILCPQKSFHNRFTGKVDMIMIIYKVDADCCFD
jgi:hypothetical protein